MQNEADYVCRYSFDDTGVWLFSVSQADGIIRYGNLHRRHFVVLALQNPIHRVVDLKTCFWVVFTVLLELCRNDIT
jgi:hypothetical protein